ncbi:methyltransferase domain-containing protein [Gemmatimonadota bacterium]
MTFTRFMPDLSVRMPQPELMDSEGLDRNRHVRALRALARINVLSLAARRVWEGLRARAPAMDRPFRLLDVACGGGDIVMAVKKKAQKEGLPLEAQGCDISPVAVEYARQRARERGLEVRFFQHDVKEAELPGGFDLVCSSLFLHHLTEAEAVGFLTAMTAAGKTALVQDLLRSHLGYLMASATVRVVTRSDLVRVDGLRSVTSAFSFTELGEVVRRAGLANFKIRRCWPERFCLRWGES